MRRPGRLRPSRAAWALVALAIAIVLLSATRGPERGSGELAGARVLPSGPVIQNASAHFDTQQATFEIQTAAALVTPQIDLRVLIDDNGGPAPDRWIVVGFDPATGTVTAGIGPMGTAHLSRGSVSRPTAETVAISVPRASVGGPAAPQWAAVALMTDPQGQEVVSSSFPASPAFSWGRLVRVAGADRIATAIASSFFANGRAKAVVLARSDDYADALAGAPLAAFKDAPLLLTPPDQLDPRVLSEMRRSLPSGGSVYLLGGTAALSDAVAQSVAQAGYQVVRLAGADRFQTSLSVLQRGLGSVKSVFLATGLDFADALSAGAAAAAESGAVLLTQGGALTPEVQSYLVTHQLSVYAIGSPAAAADPSATAFSGSDRYATAAAVAAHFFSTPSDVGVASGLSFPDALAGGATLGEGHGPLLLTDPRAPSPPTLGYLADHPGASVLVFGGSAAVTDQTAQALAAGSGG